MPRNQDMTAVKKLLAAALSDARNQYFQVLPHNAIPLQPADITYVHLLGSRNSVGFLKVKSGPWRTPSGHDFKS